MASAAFAVSTTTCREDLEAPKALDYRDLRPLQELQVLADAATTEIYSMAVEAGGNAAFVSQNRIETLTEILAQAETKVAAIRRLSTILSTAPDERITFIAGERLGIVQVIATVEGAAVAYVFPLRDGFSNPTPAGYRGHINQSLSALDGQVNDLQEVFTAAADVKGALANIEPSVHSITFEVDQFAAAHSQTAHYRSTRSRNRPTRLEMQNAQDGTVRDVYARLDQLATNFKNYVRRMTTRGSYSPSAAAVFRAELLRQHDVFTHWREKSVRLARQSQDHGWPAPLPAQFSALQRHAEHYQRLITGIIRSLDILSAETPLFSSGTDLRALVLSAVGSAVLSGQWGEGPLYRGVSYQPLSPYSIARNMEDHLSLVFGSHRIDASSRDTALKARIQPMLHAFGVEHMAAHDGARASAEADMPLVAGGALAIRALTPEGDDDATTQLFIFRAGDVVRINGALLRLTSVEGDERGMPTVRGQRVSADGSLGAIEFISFEHRDHWAWYASGVADFEAPIRAREERERARRNTDTSAGGMIGWGGRIFGTPRTGGAPN